MVTDERPHDQTSTPYVIIDDFSSAPLTLEQHDRLMAWWMAQAAAMRVQPARRPYTLRAAYMLAALGSGLPRNETLDYDPARDQAALHTAEAAGPQEGDDTGPGLTVDELIPEIDAVLAGWRKERTDD
jgi:hypothetical protein